MTDTSMVPRKRDGDRPASPPLIDAELADQLLGTFLGQVDAVAAHLHAVHVPGERSVGAELAVEVQHSVPGWAATTARSSQFQ
jgi:hypothetical protein